MSLTQKILRRIWAAFGPVWGVVFMLIPHAATAQGLHQTIQDISVLEQMDLLMVLIPGGSFLMGSPPSEPGHKKREEPQHAVQVHSFALSRSEVTFAQWDACVQDGGCSLLDDDYGWGRGHRPVIDVSWDNAQAFISWLNHKTHRTYRLPSEAEWEYAARSTSSGAFHTGPTITPMQANFDSTETECPPPRCLSRRQTTLIGSFAPNAFGLYDMHGNVSEWVQDCWHSDYNGAPSDGSAWQTQCAENRHVIRGGRWDNDAQHVRSASRSWGPSLSGTGSGFRLARTLR